MRLVRACARCRRCLRRLSIRCADSWTGPTSRLCRCKPGSAPTACPSLLALLGRSHQQPQQNSEECPREQTDEDAHHDAARCRKAMLRDRGRRRRRFGSVVRLRRHNASLPDLAQPTAGRSACPVTAADDRSAEPNVVPMLQQFREAIQRLEITATIIAAGSAQSDFRADQVLRGRGPGIAPLVAGLVDRAAATWKMYSHHAFARTAHARCRPGNALCVRAFGRRDGLFRAGGGAAGTMSVQYRSGHCHFLTLGRESGVISG